MRLGPKDANNFLVVQASRLGLPDTHGSKRHASRPLVVTMIDPRGDLASERACFSPFSTEKLP